MKRLLAFLSGEHLLVFLFCMAVILGPAIAALFQPDYQHFPDYTTYVGLAHFDMAQNPVRRYRVIIPLAASALNFLFSPLFSRFSPSYYVGDYSLAFSFFLVNTVLTSLFGLLIYRYCKAFGTGRVAALVGTLAMLTCRYTIYMAAYPLVDSLFCVVIALSLLGINTRNERMLLWAVLLGPFAKESFLFIAPLIFFFGHVSKGRQLLWFAASGLLVFTFRYFYDRCFPAAAASLPADMAHVPNLVLNLPKLFSPYTLGKVLMNTGLWILAPVLVFCMSAARGKAMVKKLDGYLLWFLLSVVVQMLLSGSMERMFYLAMPLLCVVVALSVQELGQLYRRQNA